MLQLSLMHVTYAVDMRIFVLLLLAPSLANAGDIYTRDGVTDGDTFYLAPAAFANDDPAYQSWVTYSLMKSTCQLEIGGKNPARASSFDCEFRSRQHLVNAWQEKRSVNPDFSDAYLDELADVQHAGFLAEYTVKYFGKKHWALPDGLRTSEFLRWRKQGLRGHKPVTRIIGSWNYQKKAASPY
ncbi:MAG: hypothetical protein K0U72_08640 [Gammaproteobacteria bacterium]|nr:hypothetical protein [Gammaproteobacteria bacterium]